MKRLLIILAFLLSASLTADAQPTFDLVLYGRHLSSDNLKIALEKNPGLQNSWNSIPPREFEFYTLHPNGASVLIVTGLDSSKYVGQDIRENYIAVKLTAGSDGTASPPFIRIRGLWGVHSQGNYSDQRLSRIKQLIEESPNKWRDRTFAALVRPSPKTVTEQPYIEHIELDVRHLKPGIQEVRWLEILFE